MDVPEFQYLSYDKEQLMQTIDRFDNGVTVEEVVGQRVQNNPESCHTVLIQVLVEFICYAFIKNEDQREQVVKGVCKELSKRKFVDGSLIMEKNNEVRRAVKYSIFSFFKRVYKTFCPEVELDHLAVSALEKSIDVTPDSELHYNKHFTEIEKLGQGGFGVVYKAEENASKGIYAVKKIPFKYMNDACYLEVMREANNIAKLDHPNIVRYHSAWIEMIYAPSKSLNNSFTSDNSEKNIQEAEMPFAANAASGILIREQFGFMDSGSDRAVNYSPSFNQSSASSDFIEFCSSARNNSEHHNWTLGNDSGSISTQSVDEDMGNSETDYETYNGNTLPFLNIAGVLYIQMEFCDCDLRLWLDERASGNQLPFEMDVKEIFTDILNGVAYIHSKRIIHRDLKPQNIFYLSSKNTLKIGDFGLATLPNHFSNSSEVSGVHSTAIGTRPYAAPEQLKSNNYSTEVDIYSLGIILIELMNTCSTRAEFFDIIANVKKGKITDEMKKLPAFVDLVETLVSDNPRDRKTAIEILDMFDKDSKTLLKESKETLKEKEEKIRNMEAVIIKQDLEIQRLKAILDKYHIQLDE